ncbi:MAG: histidine kinase dimerization/phosphoacceptor domain -containing protein [Pseudomonadota bacterium]
MFLYILISIILSGVAWVAFNAWRRNQREIENEILSARLRMLQDGQHDIKNSLQILSSFIRRSLRDGDYEDTDQGHLSEVNRRITSISLLHNHMSVCGEALCVHFDEFIEDLVDVLRSAAPSLSVRANIPRQSLPLEYRSTTPIGLILVECFANLAHARQSGRISVTYEQDGRGAGAECAITFSYVQGADTFSLFDADEGLFNEPYLRDLTLQTGVRIVHNSAPDARTKSVTLIAPITTSKQQPKPAPPLNSVSMFDRLTLRFQP